MMIALHVTIMHANSCPQIHSQQTPSLTPSKLPGQKPKYVYDVKNFCIGAVEACQSTMVLTSHKDWINHDDKHCHKFHLEFVAGLPKGQDIQNIHVESLLSVKDNEVQSLQQWIS